MNPTLPKSSYKNLDQFNYHSRPRNSLSLINQKIEIKSMEISPEGKSGGVLFVETPDGSFVMKCSNDVPTDFFFNQLAITLGLSVPLMTTLSCYTEQFSNIVFAIEKYCQGDGILYARIKSKLDFPFYEVMEYIPSISLAHTGSKKFKAYMIEDYKLYSLGMCLAFDLIINNSDRLKLLSRGPGNIKNVLIEAKDLTTRDKIDMAKDRENLEIGLQNFVFIDHDGHMLDKNERISAANMQKIMQKIIKFQLQMIMYLRNEGKLPQDFLKFVEQINFYTQYEFSEEELRKISEGILYCTMNFIKAYESEQIQRLYKILVKDNNTKYESVNYWNTHWNRQLSRVHLSYAQEYYIKVSAIYTTYPELVNEIYDRVHPIMQKYNRNKGRRISVLNPNKQEKEEQENEDKNEDKKEMTGDEEFYGEQMKEEKKRRKWRQKLQVFKEKNYS